MRITFTRVLIVTLFLLVLTLTTFPACKVETVGDPKRPIVIEAHIVLDIRGLEKTATGIEDMVSEGVDENLPPPSEAKSLNPLGPKEAVAEVTYDIRHYTPEINQAINNRRARYRDLAVYKAEGLVGEGNNGYVAKLGGGSQVAQIVSAENKDRKTIYTTIVKQNDLEPEAIGTVQSIFANAHRGRAKAGEYIQKDDGSWVKK